MRRVTVAILMFCIFLFVLWNALYTWVPSFHEKSNSPLSYLTTAVVAITLVSCILAFILLRGAQGKSGHDLAHTTLTIVLLCSLFNLIMNILFDFVPGFVNNETFKKVTHIIYIVFSCLGLLSGVLALFAGCALLTNKVKGGK